jgi:hypothetical protein
MGQGKRLAPFIVLILSFVVLQGILTAVDSRQTPAKTAKAFIRDYYYLSPDMQEWLSADQKEAGAVQEFLNAKTDDAALQGYNIDFSRHMFTRLHVDTVSHEGDAARVNIKGNTRVAINPVYNLVGMLFRLGETYPVDVTLDLVKQDGRWLVSQMP